MIKHSIFFIAFLAVFYACSDDGGTNPTEANFTDIHSDILSIRCAKSGCHLDVRAPIMTTASTAYLNLVNRRSNQGLNYIQPGSPDSSYLYLKIIEDDFARQGSRMPGDGSSEGYLSNTQIEAIRDWILAGAPNN